MTDRSDSPSTSNVLPDAIASRLLARASELDALRNDDVTVADLRAAAAEAGISGSAFDAALAELRQSGRLPTSNPLPRRRTGARWFVVLLTGAVVLAAGLLVARLPSPSSDAPSNKVTAVAASARALIRSPDGAPSVTMAVGREGQLFSALGVDQGPDGRRVGRIDMSGAVGSATTPAALEVSDAAGEVMFTVPVDGPAVLLIVPGTGQLALGHAVRVVRDRAGAPLRAEVVTR